VRYRLIWLIKIKSLVVTIFSQSQWKHQTRCPKPEQTWVETAQTESF